MSNTSDKNNLPSGGPAAYNESAKGGAMIRHIDSELQALKDLALQMGSCAEKALEQACKIVLTKAATGLDEVNVHERRINDLQIIIDESCVNVLAKQAPVAKDLRLVIAITRINTDLERIGDQAVNIARAATELYSESPQVQVPPQLHEMAAEVRNMVRWVLDAFSRRDLDLSQKVLEQDDMIDQLKDDMIDAMKEAMSKKLETVDEGLAFIMIAKNLERMADHATNIAEEVIYLATGNDIRHGHTHTANS
jgi:phosphate transport system protein